MHVENEMKCFNLGSQGPYLDIVDFDIHYLIISSLILFIRMVIIFLFPFLIAVASELPFSKLFLRRILVFDFYTSHF